MKTDIAKKRIKADERRKQHNAIIKIIKDNGIELTEFHKEYVKSYPDTKLSYFNLRYKINSASLTTAEYNNVVELLDIIVKELSEIN